MSFYPGQRVVCVKQGRAPAWLPSAQYPTKGRIYTIRDVRDDSDLGGPPVAVLLHEINHSHVIGLPGCRREPGFHPDGFRPLDESRLDVFRQHLVNPPKEEELA